MDKNTKTSTDNGKQPNTDNDTKLKTLQALIQEGIDSGEVEYSYEELAEK